MTPDQKVAQRRPATSIRERAADVLLVAVLAMSIWDGQRIWGTEISRTRELFIIYSLVGLTLLARPWRHLPPRIFIPAATLLGMTVLGLLIWSRQFDWARGINFWNEIVILAACLLFGLTFGRKRWTSWRMIMIGAALVVGVMQVTALLFGVTTKGFSPGAPAFYAMRPVAAQLGLLLLAGFVLMLFDRGLADRIRIPMATFLGFSVVLAQHRSVWVALVVVLPLAAVSLLRGGLPRRTFIPLLVTGGFLVAAVLLPLIGVGLLPGTSSSEAGPEGLPEVAKSSDTLEWRWEMWVSRLQAPRSVMQWLFGGSLGQTAAFGPESEVMNPGNSAHNLVLDVQIMVGFVGLAIIVWFFVLAVRGVGLTDVPIFLWGALAYGIFYVWPSWAWVVLGAAAAMSVNALRQSSSEPERRPMRDRDTGPSSDAANSDGVRAGLRQDAHDAGD